MRGAGKERVAEDDGPTESVTKDAPDFEPPIPKIGAMEAQCPRRRDWDGGRRAFEARLPQNLGSRSAQSARQTGSVEEANFSVGI